MSETKNNLQFKDDKLHLEDEVVMKKVSGIPVNQEDEKGTINVDANINIGGSASINGDVTVKGSVTIDGTSYKVIENPEYVWAIIDNDDKILCGIKTDGKFVADIDGIDEKIQEAINQMQTIIDEAQASIDEKIAAIDEKFDFISWIEDPEGRSEITTDSEGKIISYRDADGVKHEEVGIKTDSATINHLNLTESGMTEFQQALKDAGFQPGGAGDWSDKENVHIPIPRVCAIVNFGLDSQATSKSDRPDYEEGVNGDIPTFIEFYDMDGNYFKKPILLSAQGASSMSYYIKNQAFDLDDGSTIKFGEWVAQDSFHVKKYYIDNFRGQCIVGYWLTEQVYKTYPYGERRPWDYLNANANSFNGLGKIDKDFETGALAHPDGFPVMVYFNGTCWGLYTFNLKKHRDNYYQNKKNTNHIILDGALGTDQIFGNISTYGNIIWDEFEIRNPKPKKKKDGWEMTDIDGNAYNGDFPKELIGEDSPNYDSSNQSHVKTAQVKNNIIRLSKALKDLGPDATKEQYEQYFNAKFVIDYYLISNVLYHFDGFVKNWIWCVWDGNIWTPTMYDLDSIFGMHWQGGYIVNEGPYLGAGSGEPTYYMGKNRLYWTDVKARYAYLRQKGIFSVENIVNLMEKWVNWCGYDNIKNDLEVYAPETPSYRKNLVNSKYWEFVAHNGRVGSKPEYDPEKDDYAAGDLVQFNSYVYRAKSSMPAGTYPSGLYEYYPQVAGFYNSILRVKNWLENRIIVLDSYFEYSNN